MIKYNVIENQGKVIARLDNCANDVVNLISKKTGITMECDELQLNNSYKGIAKCHPEDVFDIEEGKRIAKERVIEKYNRAFNKALCIATDITYSAYQDVSEIENKYFRD